MGDEILESFKKYRCLLFFFFLQVLGIERLGIDCKKGSHMDVGWGCPFKDKIVIK